MARRILIDPRARMSASRELVRVDEAPIRAEVAKVRQQALARLERLQSEWERFREKDMPQFERWMDSTFGDVLAEIRAATVKYARLFSQAEDAAHDADAMGVSLGEAYRNILKRNEAEDAEEQARATQEHEEFQERLRGRGIDPGQMERCEYEQEFLNYKARIDIEQFRSASADEPIELPGRERPQLSADIKRVYRKLAMLLHPDLSSGEIPNDRELWLATQRAYDEGDLSRLQAILERVSSGEADSPRVQAEPTISIWEMLKELAGVRRKTGDLERELRKARQRHAWGFANLSLNSRKASLLKHRTRRDLEEERDHYLNEIQKLEEQIERWLDADEFISPRTRSARRPRGSSRPERPRAEP